MGYVQELRWFAHISRCTMLCKDAVHTKNCCGGVHTIECAGFVGRCAPQQELWEVLCILWEVYIIEGVRIVGGAQDYGRSTRRELWEHHSKNCGRCYGLWSFPAEINQRVSGRLAGLQSCNCLFFANIANIIIVIIAGVITIIIIVALTFALSSSPT